ncbi:MULTISPECIES: guanylate kinase [Petrimonas]|jgi:guanylate kinase|uniref:Guanylate kinase n=1 Tax=Petrimonas mucosa TaxID=1642646 RepID=A0A1G4G811_9BACT|nr:MULTISPECIES: guanylate kinase [Petrimonas]MDD3560404.1 guanylate kinase [Petrimonas mucosa]SCM58534.1 Guanylate kinase {ECO:0000255/HAMAP-Rule:MF_00328} [Petrimonas mucosa]SFU28547.1 guanylate kinase [Porphyromonadaceae bacterium KHP3R9]HHT30291.1 guanylate kinase [Petrimonas mucosa]
MSKLIIFSAPSGAGKSTIVRHMLAQDLNLQFSISATSRQPRGEEQNGVEYFFLTPGEFKERIANGDFLEYEEVYPDKFYGTLKSEVDRILAEGKNVVFDIDCIGGLNVKRIYGDRALSIFVMPPSIQVLRERLEKRGTDSPEIIEGRLAKAEYEISFAPQFDLIVMNDDFDKAKEETYKAIKEFLEK